MVVKLVFLLFCCALINAKSLVQRDPRREANGEIKHAKLPDGFRNLIRGTENDDLDRMSRDHKPGASPQLEAKDDENKDEEDSFEENEEEIDEIPENTNIEAENEEKKEAKEEEEEEEEEEEDKDDDLSQENADDVRTEDQKKDNKDESNVDKDADEEDEEEEETEDKKKDDEGKSNAEEVDEDEVEEDEEDTPDEENKDQNENQDKNDNDANAEEVANEEPNESSEEETLEEDITHLQLPNAPLGSEMKFPETFKFPKQSLNLPPPAEQPSPADDKLADKVANFFALESLVKSFLPSKNSSPKETNEGTEADKETLIEEIEQLEKNNEVAEQKPANDNLAARPAIDLDLDSNPSGAFISQAVPKNLKEFQVKFQEAKDLWQKTNFNDLPAKIQRGVQDLWQKTDFNDIKAKFQQGVEGLWQKNVRRHTPPLVHKESKVGFGGRSDKPNKFMEGDATTYVNKAVQRAQAQLDENGRTINANNPPLTINLIPGTPVTFKLKYVEGAHTLDTYGKSNAIHYNKLYAFTQYKFTELRYYYDVIISPYNLFNIRKSIIVILNDAPTKMNLSVEKDSKINVLGLEFVNPQLMVDCGGHRFVNYGLNYLINDVHPVIKQKLVEIVSRDSKLMLTDYLKDAQ